MTEGELAWGPFGIISMPIPNVIGSRTGKTLFVVNKIDGERRIYNSKIVAFDLMMMFESVHNSAFDIVNGEFVCLAESQIFKSVCLV